ncbi:ferric anguibactin transport system permease protein FatD [Maritalea myrionectae]|uniref:Ferric anguibactin transport system permease protein FatD n=2 Tax=Maritalea myrionectae TaxID=454601 RepID=A0A2R4MBJ7_9HYPH|nr:ferric anguibactin transport system permease protein FatD [Maritalea myrionectae]
MKRGATILMALLVLLGVATLSLFVGVIDLDPQRLLNPAELELLMISRLPRTLAVLITGSALAVCGTIMQLLVRNRFVEPMTAGTGQGAMLGILIAILYFPTTPLIAQISIAAATALVSSIGLMLIVTRLPASKPLYIALVGLIYGGIIGAGVTFVAYQADLLQYIEIWTTGEFSGVLQGRYETLWVAAIVALLAYLIADQFAIVGMGRTTAISLGLNYNQVVVLGLITISIVTALTVVTVGMIPFVGLVIPNIVSRLYGDNARRTLPITAFFGASLVLVCDIIGRLVRYPFEIPVGTIMGVVGALIFLWILYGRGRHAR